MAFEKVSDTEIKQTGIEQKYDISHIKFNIQACDENIASATEAKKKWIALYDEAVKLGIVKS